MLQSASETLKRNKMACSFHNHAVEFQPVDGVKPIDILAKAKGLLFHIDVNVCRRAGADPVAFMKQYPGKTESLLLPTARRTAIAMRRFSAREIRHGRTSSPPRKASEASSITC